MQSLARLLAGSYPFPIFSPDSKLIIDRDESYISHSPTFEGGVPDCVGFFADTVGGGGYLRIMDTINRSLSTQNLSKV